MRQGQPPAGKSQQKQQVANKDLPVFHFCSYFANNPRGRSSNTAMNTL
jgi:hypothetical protein